MKAICEEDFRQQLESAGFRTIYTWQDGPHAFYPEHTHAMETEHIVLRGARSR